MGMDPKLCYNTVVWMLLWDTEEMSIRFLWQKSHAVSVLDPE